MLQDLEVVAAALGVFQPGLGLGGREEREEAAAHVVLVLGLLGAPQFLAVDRVGRVELAARQEELDGVVEVAGGGRRGGGGGGGRGAAGGGASVALQEQLGRRTVDRERLHPPVL